MNHALNKLLAEMHETQMMLDPAMMTSEPIDPAAQQPALDVSQLNSIISNTASLIFSLGSGAAFTPEMASTLSSCDQSIMSVLSQLNGAPAAESADPYGMPAAQNYESMPQGQPDQSQFMPQTTM